jgi:DNA-binding NarL/FixJ family response regulator
MSRIRVLIVDDQPLARAGFRAVLEATGQIVVVAEAENGGEALEQARRHDPDVVLMDVRMPGMDGIEATRKMPRQRVLILTTFGLDEYIIEALRARERAASCSRTRRSRSSSALFARSPPATPSCPRPSPSACSTR